MSLVTEVFNYGPGGIFSAYAARPRLARPPLPGIIVIQEIWGADDHIEDVTRRFAEAGYAAFTPDLYARHGRRPAPLERSRVKELQEFMNTLPVSAYFDSEKRAKAMKEKGGDRAGRFQETFDALFAPIMSSPRHDLPQFMDPLLELTFFLYKEHEAVRGQKLGSVGFCLGGTLSGALAAKSRELAAAVVYYGNPMPDEDLDAIACPILGHYAENDPRITPHIPVLAEKLKAKGKSFEYHIYPKSHHAFFNDNRPSYSVESARLAFVRTLQFFAQHLA